MKIKIILTCLFFASLSVSSEEMEDWYKLALKSPNPNELAYFASAGEDCPIKTSAIEDAIEGVFIRSRIKPSKSYYDNDRIYLNVILNCLKLESRHPAFTLSINFGKYNPKPSVLFDKDYGYFGVGAEGFIIQGLKRRTEDAITDYLKANFNL